MKKRLQKEVRLYLEIKIKKINLISVVWHKELDFHVTKALVRQHDPSSFLSQSSESRRNKHAHRAQVFPQYHLQNEKIKQAQVGK